MSISSGTARDTYVSGGQEYLFAGSITSKTTLIGGTQYISGGVASNSKFLEAPNAVGGAQFIFAGGEAIHTVLIGGQYGQSVLSGGYAFDTKFSDGANGSVSIGGVAKKVTVGSESFYNVNSGGKIEDSTIQSGVLVFEAGAKVIGDVTFSGSGGVLAIDDTKMPTAVISGFASGDQIDLHEITYSAGETATVEKTGIVTVSAGGKSYNLHIAGAVVGETDFTVTSAFAGIVLSKSAPAQMDFLRPAAAPTETSALENMAPRPMPEAAAPAPWTNSATRPIRETVLSPDPAHALIVSAGAHF